MSREPQVRRVLVSGGSRGIGLRIAHAFHEEGNAVALLARDAEQLERAARSFGGDGQRMLTVAADVRSSQSVEAAVARTVEGLGGIDILVNTAAAPADQLVNRPIAEFDEDSLRAELETKTLGYLRTIKFVAPHFIAQRWGRIINIGGQSVRHTGSIAATVRNAAISALTKNVADELGSYSVTANVVHPGFTVTERTPELLEGIAVRTNSTVEEARKRLEATTSNRKLNTADDIAALVVFLASERGSVINGEALHAGGGVAGSIFSY
ncbi:SDR family oxidoreductase [Mesorhizobium sp. CAU 1732]|uniref:SDR family NAD(P)-dependent oxidoreductase n=1 Tax=Mesorhizobium sp. CAU 1732 TaxID=3140358 RepID=UPI0032610EC5